MVGRRREGCPADRPARRSPWRRVVTRLAGRPTVRYGCFTNQGRAIMKRSILLVLGLATALVLLPSTAGADNATHHYVLMMEQPNFGVAPNGDQIAISGEVDYSVNPKSVEGGGSFTHTSAAGTVLATGTWEATRLLGYQSYGC